MKTMSARAFRKLHAEVEVGTVLMVPQDNKSQHGVPDPYKAIVIKKGETTFTTKLLPEYNYQMPLTWHESYNFAGAYIFNKKSKSWIKKIMS